MSVTVKVFYERANGQKEIRRFPINASSGSDSFLAIRDKVKELYSSLAHGNFQLFWQDSDGDRVAFSSVEELQEALGFVTDGVLRVYIPEAKEQPQAPTGQATQESAKKPQQPSEERKASEPKQPPPPQQESQQQSRNQSQGQNSNDGPLHPGVTCDGCEGAIYGMRFKCCVCPDYDLCGSCEGKGMHCEHDMYKINQPRVNPFAFLPPHLGRHLHRHMRNCGNTASASASASAGPEGSSQSQSQSSASEDYLNRMGANIAAFLDPFGIDVSYDIHNNGEHQHGGWGRGQRCGGGRGSGRGSRCGGGGGGQSGAHTGAWAFCPAWEEMEKRCASEAKNTGNEKPAQAENSNKMETDAPKTPTPNGNHDVPMEEESRRASPMSDKKSNGSDDWTFVSNQEAQNPNTPIPMPAPGTNAPPTTTPVEPSAPNASTGAGKPNTTGSNIYPNLRIKQSLDQMLSMGFTNTDNWLSELLQEYDGDIGLTLDAVKAKATQQLDSLRSSQ